MPVDRIAKLTAIGFLWDGRQNVNVGSHDSTAFDNDD